MLPSGTAFVGVLYAPRTESLLSVKFQLLPARPPVPQQERIAIVGLGRVGQEVAEQLLTMKQAIVGITLNADFDPTKRPR